MNMRTTLPAIAFMLVLPFAAGCGGGKASGEPAVPTIDARPATRSAADVTPATASPVAPAAAVQAAPTQAASSPAQEASTPAPASTAAASATTAAPAATVAPPTAAPPAVPAVFTLSMRDETFSTTSLAVHANQPVTIIQRNDGKEFHNWALCQGADCGQFVVEGDLLPAGKQSQVAFTIAEPGTYKYVCEVHTKTMTGTIVVS